MVGVLVCCKVVGVLSQATGHSDQRPRRRCRAVGLWGKGSAHCSTADHRPLNEDAVLKITCIVVVVVVAVGVVWCGVVWCGVVWCRAVPCRVVNCRALRCVAFCCVRRPASCEDGKTEDLWLEKVDKMSVQSTSSGW